MAIHKQITRTWTNHNPSLTCSRALDKFTVSSTKGNGKLTYPVGLITSDEAEFAGLNRNSENTNNYLYSSNPYWTMTPAYYNGIDAYNFIIKDGKISECEVNKENYIRPVITLKKEAKVKSGNGSIISPYVIE